MISDKHKFIYIHVPKCGGMSMTNHFLDLSEDYPTDVQGKSKNSIMVRRPSESAHKHFGRKYMHSTASELRDFLGDEVFNDYYKFATIRNTYERLISLYFWATRHEDINIKKFLYLIGYYGLDGREGINYKHSKLPHSRGSAPINFFLCDDSDNLLVDDVFDISTINQDCEIIYDNLGLPLNRVKNRFNTSKHKHYSEYYTQELLDIVEEVYEKEINKFDFKFNNKSGKHLNSKF